jgi:hypothetical protein
MTVDPREILLEISPQDVPASEPPDIANYREADLQGVACAFCSKFTFTGVSAGGVDTGDNEVEIAGLPKGYCHQWEANVDGWYVCDRFSSGMPSYDENGQEVWADFAGDERILNVIHFDGGDDNLEKQENGLFRKAILRTGDWPFTPGPGGMAKKPLKIVRDGKSDPAKGIIALSELVENFKAKVLPYVPLTLSDNDKEHPHTKAKLTQWAKGFIRNVFIEDRDDISLLFADIEVTEPDTREKIENGTYADVSSGVPWGVMRKSDGEVFGAVLEHVTISNNPFVDELGPWALAAADDKNPVEVINYGAQVEPVEDPKPETEDEPEDEPERPAAEEEPTPLSHNELRAAVETSLRTTHALSTDYHVTDIRDNAAIVINTLAEVTWVVPFEIRDDDTVSVSPIPDWEMQRKEGEVEPVALSDPPRQLSELEQARRLRELRLSQSNRYLQGGGKMSGIDIAALEGVELSDEARAVVQNLVTENADLKKKDRDSSVNSRIKELEGMGFDQRPGFLKLYRQVFLSDDGGPAAVLLSDDGRPVEQVTALTILDRAIDAIKGAEGKVEFSDQHTASGNDDPPPATAEGEGDEESVEERTKKVKKELGIKS